MKTYFECIPCFLQQTIDSTRLITDDEAIQEQALRMALNEISGRDSRQSPAEIGKRIHGMIRKLLGDNDPYRLIKEKFNRFALKLYPELKRRVRESRNPLETAVRLAIGGNIIDFGVGAQLDESGVFDTIERSLDAPISPYDMNNFLKAVDRAEDILYLGDNTGEIVFDRLLIEELLPTRVTFVVRGKPIINDATITDARVTGMTEIVEVIDNGSDAPGTVLGDCSEAFLQRFEEADLIISKGQGNYETLNDTRKKILFVLMAKCPVVARHLGCNVGDLILKIADCLSNDNRCNKLETGII